MNMLGAKVVPVQAGARTLKDAMNEALRDWVAKRARHVLLHRHGGRSAPLPPPMVRDFQCVIGEETKSADAGGRRAPARLGLRLHRRRLQRHRACSTRSSTTPSVEIFGVEAAGFGLDKKHAASLAGGRPGVLHGNRTYLLMDEHGQIEEGHSISAGLDYPGIGPEHAWLRDTGRVTYLSATDAEALDAFDLVSPSWKASSRRWSRRTRSPACSDVAQDPAAGPPDGG